MKRGGRPQTRLLAGGSLALAWLGGVAAAEEAPAGAELSAHRIHDGAAANLTVRNTAVPRFAWDGPIAGVLAGQTPTRIELQFAAGVDGAPLEVAVAQRASRGDISEGRFDRRGNGSELRVGRGLVERRGAPGVQSIYAFLASDDEALTWQPGVRNEFGVRGGSIALQDQVQIGDHSAGVTYQREGMQASFAYVERQESSRVGQQSYSLDQSFAGFTVTMRR